MKNKIHRFVSFVLALALVIGLLPSGIISAEESAGPNYRWELGTDAEGNEALVSVSTGGIYTENVLTRKANVSKLS